MARFQGLREFFLLWGNGDPGDNEVNDTACGRRVNDIALRRVAQLFEQTLRRIDLLTRWRSDEFLAWLQALPGTFAFATAEPVRLRVAESSLDALDGLDLPPHISIGATLVSSPIHLRLSLIAPIGRRQVPSRIVAIAWWWRVWTRRSGGSKPATQAESRSRAVGNLRH